MASDQGDYQEIVAKRDKEKRRIENAHHERPEIAQVEDQRDELAKETGQAVSLSAYL
jgi:hypothetical protein